MAADARGFDFFRRRRDGYAPRTPAAALKAIGTGTLSVEHFIHASASVKPLDEEPFDMDAVERILARPILTLQTGIMLKRVLSRLIGSREQETALFGAEGINALEGRALARIAKLKASLEEGEDGFLRSRLAREYYELAELHADAPAVRVFYLREARESLRGSSSREAASAGDGSSEAGMDPDVLRRSDLALAVDILVALGLNGQALERIAEMGDAEDPEVLLLTARVAFHQKDYRHVAECCRRLSAKRDALGEKERRLVSFWTGRDG